MLVTAFSPAYPIDPGPHRAAGRMKDLAEGIRSRQRDWLRAITEKHKISPTRLAKKAGLTATTITRKLNDPEDTSILSEYNVARVSAVVGEPVPSFAGADGPHAFREPEAARYVASEEDLLEAAVTAMTNGLPNADPWVLTSRALEYKGYRPGDVLIVDLSATPKPGDVVCVQLYGREGERTVFRVYEPPIVIGAGPEGDAMQPRFVNDDSLAIMGVVIASFRRREGRG